MNPLKNLPKGIIISKNLNMDMAKFKLNNVYVEFIENSFFYIFAFLLGILLTFIMRILSKRFYNLIKVFNKMSSSLFPLIF